MSGEIGIMSVEGVEDWELQAWATAKSNVESLTEGGQTDWVLPTREQLLAIFENEKLVEDFNLPLNNAYWSIEEKDVDQAWKLNQVTTEINADDKDQIFFAIPTRRVNHYGLPLLGDMILNDYDEEQIVFNVVASTRSVDVVNITMFVGSVPVTWSEPSFILPLRTQLTTLFSSQWLVETVLQLPLDANYWSSEEDDGDVYLLNVAAYPDILIEVGTPEALLYGLPVKTIVIE